MRLFIFTQISAKNFRQPFNFEEAKFQRFKYAHIAF